jgi:hypothetical protein
MGVRKHVQEGEVIKVKHATTQFVLAGAMAALFIGFLIGV